MERLHDEACARSAQAPALIARGWPRGLIGDGTRALMAGNLPAGLTSFAGRRGELAEASRGGGMNPPGEERFVLAGAE
jgi:hypothetical protein